MKAGIAPARAIESAVFRVLDRGLRTADVRQEGCEIVGCVAMGDAVRRELTQMSL